MYVGAAWRSVTPDSLNPTTGLSWVPSTRNNVSTTGAKTVFGGVAFAATTVYSSPAVESKYHSPADGPEVARNGCTAAPGCQSGWHKRSERRRLTRHTMWSIRRLFRGRGPTDRPTAQGQQAAVETGGKGATRGWIRRTAHGDAVDNGPPAVRATPHCFVCGGPQRRKDRRAAKGTPHFRPRQRGSSNDSPGASSSSRRWET